MPSSELDFSRLPIQPAIHAPQVSQSTPLCHQPLLPGSLLLNLTTSISITNCFPALPWLVNPEKPSPDAIQYQLAIYLIMGSTTAKTLPPAHNWADKSAQAPELPHKLLSGCILKERIWN
ncbi:Intracellular distribution of mitochondria [Puccinia graminis f. sp. tritici]|uniref:Intracellular distribution of mitochondria n=1 Tax=Puccinia graminis f. sp. tritici TaxID=56615 RepID=A0A5B0M6K4_PUCGR|nr:Intracellular distribution of mitochondria [Puccinia graminis f. sp. tritici]